MDEHLQEAGVDEFSELRARFDAARAVSPRPRALPEELWTAAATLATAHTVHRVAKALRLNTDSLKRHVLALGGSSAPPSARARFVPLRAIPPASSAPPCNCSVELVAPDGARMSVRITGDPHSTLSSLAASFLGRRA